MLYPKNQQEDLSDILFQNPTSEYRGTPFWSWNCKLDKDLLGRQIQVLKGMGFGGFHMHSRTGMATPYLSEEFMELVRFCTKRAKEEKMLAWLYDEDRWPSGSAGGLVTKNPAYRERCLLFTPQSRDDCRLLASYDVTLDRQGCLQNYRRLCEGQTGDNVWRAYIKISDPDPWYNNQTYVNTLDKKAVDAFIETTYEAYKRAVGEDFGGAVPAIFTDEPQFRRKSTLGFAFDRREVALPFSDDLPETYRAAYGADLLDSLPELIWDLPEGKPSLTRYRYHDHIAQRFADAFANNCGGWCRENGLMLTGHMMEEPTLESQTAALGDAMRSYGGFGLPGIDMLCDWREYNTAKQAQSAVHQYGREGMLSELYGVTNWDFDFRGHKLQGDWQAALGVTVRVPHLSWVSMEGEAKRDYPASINYQSPWHKEYALIEDHFARVNTAMTRGKPLVRIGVVHPIESYWLHWGPSEQTAGIREQLDQNHRDLTDWLLFGQLDFDFICESLLPSQCPAGGAPLQVGEMAYDTVIIPGCQTLRSSTAQRLAAFAAAGGRLIVMGEAPCLLDAEEAGDRLDFLERAERIPFQKFALLKALEAQRQLDIRNAWGRRTDHLLTQLRQDGEDRWLFIANGRKPHNQDLIQAEAYVIRLTGLWTPTLYDTMTGEILPLTAEFDGADTVIRRTLCTQDSLLLRLQPGRPAESGPAGPAGGSSQRPAVGEGRFDAVPVEFSEPNVLLLDTAEYALDGGDYRPEEEILRLDNILRSELGLPPRGHAIAQPWVVPPEAPTHKVSLRFTVESEIDCQALSLALEHPEEAQIRWNGQTVDPAVAGWYVDESIKTVALPGLRKGVNILEITWPFGRSTNLEWCYLLGDFGVRVSGFVKTVIPPVRELTFGDVTRQGLPFYGGNILYKLPVSGDGRDLSVQVPFYRGALVGVLLDGRRVGSIVFDPYTVTLPGLTGDHEIGLLLFGNRVNSFGPVHNCDRSFGWYGPDAWRTGGDRWTYEYALREFGILKSPALLREDAGQ
ncbi:MAG: hypothetical protein HFE86_05470 [Clostridiales bacterium]|nr:hypothetical protein [Clostridiales bacterium]